MKKTLITLLAAAMAAPVALLATRAHADAPPVQTTHEVKMYMEGADARFEPATITIRRGDRIKFTTMTGGPHNVWFDPAKVPDAAERALAAGMPNQMAPLAGPFVMNPGDSYTVSFAGVPAGRYEVFCMPHTSLNMKGVVIVQ
ncbi:MAG TPA: plastocyanin/azurin family copper-binding protein [Longimicrobium sp.]|nr:plastocyanin/azurin family copper-binding protein [Longimicrobium sp.]